MRSQASASHCTTSRPPRCYRFSVYYLPPGRPPVRQYCPSAAAFVPPCVAPLGLFRRAAADSSLYAPRARPAIHHCRTLLLPRTRPACAMLILHYLDRWVLSLCCSRSAALSLLCSDHGFVAACLREPWRRRSAMAPSATQPTIECTFCTRAGRALANPGRPLEGYSMRSDNAAHKAPFLI